MVRVAYILAGGTAKAGAADLAMGSAATVENSVIAKHREGSRAVEEIARRRGGNS